MSHLQHGTSHKSRLPQPELCVGYETQKGRKAGGNLLQDRQLEIPRLGKGSVPADLSAGHSFTR